MPVTNRRRVWRYIRGLAAPVVLWALVLVTLWEPLQSWLHGQELYDKDALTEWIEEARLYKETLPEMVHSYLERVDTEHRLAQQLDLSKDESKQRLDRARKDIEFKAEEIAVHLAALGTPTRIYASQLPLFPNVYRLQVCFADQPESKWITWDSRASRHPSQYRQLQKHYLDGNRAWINVKYQFHAFSKRERNELAARANARWLFILAVAATAASFLWLYRLRQQELERERQRALAEQQVHEAERLHLQEALRRQEAERRQEEAERRALELKSQLFANIGIMAGSYAHNIKNLLVRPNDLLQRCLERDGLSSEQDHMLREVRQTLATVTERLQQILHTVRRDPSRAEMKAIDLNELAAEMKRTWEELAREKWKLMLTAELWPEPLWIHGDISHLNQAAENLLFNARDATFEMRNHLRELARRQSDGQAEDRSLDRRQALIAAASWKGQVTLATRREGDRGILEVRDNGIGMSEEVRRRCTQTHFSTKRDNALYEGYNSGMGLGLSFVVVILEHHQATLEIESEPLAGAVFRVSFPLS
jgi:signal transduction histidine kinase